MRARGRSHGSEPEALGKTERQSCNRDFHAKKEDGLGSSPGKSRERSQVQAGRNATPSITVSEHGRWQERSREGQEGQASECVDTEPRLDSVGSH